MEFQTRLYDLRKKAGLSQEELANLVGVTRQAVQKWEAEFPKVKDTIPKSTLTLLPEHAVVRLLGIECQFLVTS